MELPPFDVSTLRNESQRMLCESLIKRGHEILDSLANAYLPSRPKISVSITIRHSPYFNAAAHSNRNGHFIDLHVASVLLLQVFFEKLLSSPDVIPELPHLPAETKKWTTPFIRDLSTGVIDDQFDITLDDSRHSVALILQDFCAWFIMLHEVSHLVCGHCRGMVHFFGRPTLQEFFGIELLILRGRYLRRSWEYDADVTASAILSQYIHHFHQSGKNPHLAKAFEFLKGDLEKLIGLVTAALFGMFVYLSQMEYRLNVRSYHPHPMLRIKYIARTLLRRAAADYNLDKDRIYEWQMEFMAQIAREMEAIGLFNWDEFDAAFSETDGRVSKLAAVAGRLRASCKKWSWFPIDRWEAMGG